MREQKMLTSVALLALMLQFAVGQEALSQRQQLYRLGQANNHFATNLHRRLSEVTEGNVFFSPFSISSVLTMLYRGAQGETAEELKRVLGYERLNDSAVFSTFQYYLTEVLDKMNPKMYTINCASAMIVDNTFPILPQYKTDLQELFQAYVQDGNIAEESAAIADKVNTWAKIKTKGKISKLVEHIDSDTTLFLASAAYFKGAWKTKFDPENTKNHPFYNGGRRKNASDVPMMHAHASFRYFEDDDEDFTAVELFYEGRNMSMVIYLPNENDGLYDLEESMTASMLLHVRRQMYYMKVHLTMPKFKLEEDKSVTVALQDLGLHKIFKIGANLSGMITERSILALDEVRHKAMIEVNEKGSVAAAVTRAIMTKSMPRPIPDPEFKVNHPFLFAIFDVRSHLILFMGRVNYL